MIGDVADFLRRLKIVLPPSWFPDSTPILDGMLTGAAYAWSQIYILLGFARQQSRIATAVGPWLDFVALDFFGSRVRRGGGETDSAFRGRIDAQLMLQRVTRAALLANVVAVTGRVPVIIEPANPGDTGVWGHGCAWSILGVWGSLMMPQQAFVTAYRPNSPGVVAADADIIAAVENVIPIAMTAWMNIQN